MHCLCVYVCACMISEFFSVYVSQNVETTELRLNAVGGFSVVTFWGILEK